MDIIKSKLQANLYSIFLSLSVFLCASSMDLIQFSSDHFLFTQRIKGRWLQNTKMLIFQTQIDHFYSSFSIFSLIFWQTIQSNNTIPRKDFYKMRLPFISSNQKCTLSEIKLLSILLCIIYFSISYCIPL